MENNIIFVKPGDCIWDESHREIRGKINGKDFFVPTSELTLQNFRWGRDVPRGIKRVAKEGFEGVLQEPQDGKLVVSIKERHSMGYNRIKEGETYQGKIIDVKNDALYVEVDTVIVRVYITDCSRSRMNDLRDFFRIGNILKVKILHKDKSFPFRISGSRKEAYPEISEMYHHYEIDREVFVRACERLNFDGYRVELTPNIPGILNGPEELLDKIQRGQRIKVKITKIEPLGIKCKVSNWRL